jgi:hypothetical protein
VRAFDDYDESPIVLERFSKCTLTPSDNDYIAYKIGSYDGLYETKSKYITVEVNESIATQNSVPCGFLGYPLSMYGGIQVMDGTPTTNNQSKPKEASDEVNVIAPVIRYNLNYDNEVKNRKQYFGLSTSMGIDVDMFTYKGHAAYNSDPRFLSNGFHLDSRLDMTGYAYEKDSKRNGDVPQCPQGIRQNRCQPLYRGDEYSFPDGGGAAEEPHPRAGGCGLCHSCRGGSCCGSRGDSRSRRSRQHGCSECDQCR